MTRCPICKSEAAEIELWSLRRGRVRLQVSWSLQGFRHCSNSEEGAHPQTVGARANAGQGAGIRRPSADQFGAVVGFRSARCLGSD